MSERGVIHCLLRKTHSACMQAEWRAENWIIVTNPRFFDCAPFNRRSLSIRCRLHRVVLSKYSLHMKSSEILIQKWFRIAQYYVWRMVKRQPASNCNISSYSVWLTLAIQAVITQHSQELTLPVIRFALNRFSQKLKNKIDVDISNNREISARVFPRALSITSSDWMIAPIN